MSVPVRSTPCEHRSLDSFRRLAEPSASEAGPRPHREGPTTPHTITLKSGRHVSTASRPISRQMDRSRGPTRWRSRIIAPRSRCMGFVLSNPKPEPHSEAGLCTAKIGLGSLPTAPLRTALARRRIDRDQSGMSCGQLVPKGNRQAGVCAAPRRPATDRRPRPAWSG